LPTFSGDWNWIKKAMRRGLFAAAILICLLVNRSVFCAVARFEKLSEHCYYLQSKVDGANVGAVVTDEGVLLINPPAQPGLASTLDALKRLTTKPVRWITGTNYRFAHSAAFPNFEEQGVVFIGTKPLQDLAAAIAEGTATESSSSQPKTKESTTADTRGPSAVCTQFLFGNQMRLFPAGVELRIFALQHKAHTAADIVVFVPAEKVLFLGDLFDPGNYPTIDTLPGGGSALGWFDGFKQTIDAVPLLKVAKPQPKVDTKPGEEKSLEELVTVVASRGAQSNLQEMKGLLEISNKLRADVTKAVAAGRDREHFLGSAAADPYHVYGNLEAFVTQLFAALAAK
jgi:glyoxylase-like metal-dependent hydrolase (beta-lactamase superfamily II)